MNYKYQKAMKAYLAYNNAISEEKLLTVLKELNKK